MGVATLVIIPTYNEIDSLPGQVEAVRAACPEVDILVVDDSSPDGTGYWAQERADSDSQVFVAHRKAKQGLGAAYLHGFTWALERGYGIVVEMDADGSHQAHQLAEVIAATDNAHVAIGSRWVPGGSVVNWPRRRELLSRTANRYVRCALGMPVHDATAGFRAYRSEALRMVDLSTVQSQGYCFQVDMAWRVWKSGGAITEVPIEFVERVQGASKMTGAIIREALFKVTWWGVTHRLRQLTGTYRREAAT